MKPITIGIDPGISGAIASLCGTEYRDVIDMPVMAKGKAGKNQVNAAAIADILRGLKQHCDITVAIELVGAMPGQGVTSMFNFGESLGVIRGVCAALRLPVVWVTPQQWKRKFGLLGADKDLARTRAIELYPTAPLSRKKDCGRADALLIARFVAETQRAIEVA